MQLKRRMMITAEGAYYLFVLAFVFTGAVLREINLMLVLAGMMVGALIYNARTARRMTQHVAVRRRLPDTAAAGETLTVELVSTSRLRSKGVRLIDSVQRCDDRTSSLQATANAQVADLPADRATTVHYRLVVGRRGEYRFGPLCVQSAYPFGLIRRTVEHDVPGTLLVFPRLGLLTARWHALFGEAGHGSQRRQTHVEGDFYGLRDYRSGDNRRHIHWRTSARRGNLMVRQFERALHRDVAVFVDLWQPVHATGEDREHVERAASFAATLVQHFCRHGGCRIWFCIAGAAAAPLEGTASMALAREAMCRLARADAAESRLEQHGLLGAFKQAPRRTTKVLVTTRHTNAQSADSPLADDATRRSNDARLVYVSTRGSELDELFHVDAPPPTAAQVHRD